ncbi:General alpha-glucoside permease protein [Rutstroemia sp. NJR-2017a WRK4]|nr:General alpha-glucoside permease protein [Rutstroemia sp. NJR-2017a WRK4]
MAGSSAESVEIQARGSVDDNLDVLDYMDDDPLDSSESSLLPESNQPESDEQIVSTVYLICLTISTGGLQVIWTAIMSQGSPYLSSLDVPAYLISLVWLAGPLSGALVQPYVGILSDRCQHALGRRRPFIIFGTIATIICILALPWTTDLISFLFTIYQGEPEGKAAMICKGMMAAVWIWALNIAIQPVQGGLRAIIVDCAPKSQQVKACAYASIAAGIGSILGYTAGYVSLPKYVPWLGNTQLKGLCFVASVALGSTVAMTCLTVEEKRYVDLEGNLKRKSFLATFSQIYRSIRTVPRRIKQICVVQFFAWLGWFPFLFYVTTARYLGDIYQSEHQPISKKTTTFFFPNPTPLPPSPHSIRHATFIMILFATVSLLTNLTLPHLTESVSASSTKTKPRSRFRIPGLTLPLTWTLSHILSSILIFCTLISSSFLPTSILVSLLGISWAVTQWIPLALINLEIANSQSATASKSRQRTRNAPDGEELQAGTILGLYNISIATPQIVAAVQGSAVFWMLGRVGVMGGEAMGWVIRLGSLAALVAAVGCERLL